MKQEMMILMLLILDPVSYTIFGHLSFDPGLERLGLPRKLV